tara:strand:+ start:81 stop:281 length:201 start_codon:yes stop_codon:yes gene_type:complete
VAKRSGPKKDKLIDSLNALHQRLTNVEFLLSKYLEMNEDGEPLMNFIKKQRADEKKKAEERETTVQ